MRNSLPTSVDPGTQAAGGQTVPALAGTGLRPVSMAAATRDLGQRWVVANIGFCAFLYTVLIGAMPFQEWGVAADAGTQGDLFNQILHVVIVLFLLFGSGTVMTRRQLLPLPFSFLVLFALCAMSIFWSLAPLISLRRLALVAITCWVIFRCIGDLGYARTLLLIRYALIALTLINYFTVFFTDYGIHKELVAEDSSVVGNWRGILPHKNITGATCAFTVIFLMFDQRQIPRWLSGLTIVASLVFLYYVQSRTSAGMLAFAVLCGWLIRPYSAAHRGALGLVSLLAVALGLQIVFGYSEALQRFLNDPGALTGRTAIWPLLLEYAAEHPWTGSGFGAFWKIGEDSPIWTLTDNWVAVYGGHGHNGYLDLLVTIGVPGMILAIVTLLLWPLIRLLSSQAIGKPSRSLLFALLVFCAGHNLTESSLLSGASVVQIFLVIAVALIYFQSNGSAGAHQLLRRRAMRAMRVRSFRGQAA